MYTATGPGSVRKVLRRRESLQLVMEVLSSDGNLVPFFKGKALGTRLQ